MKKMMTVILVGLLLLSLTGCGTKAAPVTPTEEEIVAEPAVPSSTDLGTEALFTMERFGFWDARKKTIKNGDLGYAITEALSTLEETGEVVPKISDALIDDSQVEDLPVERGTIWINYGSDGLFRLSPRMTEICRVETHLGEGIVLEMTDALHELLWQAWYYYPDDCWYGTYENGEVTLEHRYQVDSAVSSVEIDSIWIENKIESRDNKLTLRLGGRENKTVDVQFESYQSDDNLGSFDTKKVTLAKDGETTVDFTFYGFYNCTYFATITVDNTRIELTIDPKHETT